MTHRERILTVLGGGRADKVPWFPDLSYWLEVNRRGGTLPGDLADCDLPELHRRLDAGLPVHLYNSHASGLDGRYGPLITFEYEGVEQTVREGANERRTEIVTPVGRLVDRRKRVIELESPFVVEHQVKSVEDFAAVEYLDILSGSAGGEVQQSIFRVENPEEEALGLRFEALTQEKLDEIIALFRKTLKDLAGLDLD